MHDHQSDALSDSTCEAFTTSNTRALTEWSYAQTAPDGGCPDSGEFTPIGPAKTAAAAVRSVVGSSGGRTDGYPDNLDDLDHWFSSVVELPSDPIAPGTAVVIELDGVATIAEFFWNGELVGSSESMYAEHRFDVTDRCRPGANRFTVRCLSLSKWLAERKAPRSRWKTRVVEDQKLRLVRTTLLGRTTGWSPPTTVVGVWRDARIVFNASRGLTPPQVRTRLDATAATDSRNVGTIRWDIAFRGGIGERPQSVEARVVRRGSNVTAFASTTEFSMSEQFTMSEPSARSDQSARSEQSVDASNVLLSGEIAIADPDLWWPHSHGEPALYDVHLTFHSSSGETYAAPMISCGFRSLEIETGADGEAFGLIVNGVGVFARGGAWFPLDPTTFAVEPEELRERLRLVADGGHNMLRISGTCAYESSVFFSICDELGLMVWHDLALANFDYPQTDSFAEQLQQEVAQFLSRVANSPSLTVLCGGSEVQQQAVMMGIDVSVAADAQQVQMLHDAVRDSGSGAVVVDSSPTGGHLPFAVDSGVGHYFGVGAYRRPLTDARHANVRFAAECLAFSNVPVPSTVKLTVGEGVATPSNPQWKQRVPRDRGTGWDFEDIRDFYARELFDLDLADLRYGDPDRYLKIARAISCCIIERTFAEWRRPGSSCRGALVWTMNDLWPGAGWGLIDSVGRPKAAYWGAKRSLAPIALVGVDEGLNGLDLYAYNDQPDALTGVLEVRATKGTAVVHHGVADVHVAPRSAQRFRVDQVFGAFSDPTYAYRFGPRGFDAISATWKSHDGVLLGRYVYVPIGDRPAADPAMTIEAGATRVAPDIVDIDFTANRLAEYVTIDSGTTKVRATDDHFALAAADPYTVRLSGPGVSSLKRVFVSALNGSSEIAVTIPPIADPAPVGSPNVVPATEMGEP